MPKSLTFFSIYWLQVSVNCCLAINHAILTAYGHLPKWWIKTLWIKIWQLHCCGSYLETALIVTLCYQQQELTQFARHVDGIENLHFVQFWRHWNHTLEKQFWKNSAERCSCSNDLSEFSWHQQINHGRYVHLTVLWHSHFFSVSYADESFHICMPCYV